MKKSGKTAAGTVVIMGILAALVIFGFYGMTKEPQNGKSGKKQTEAEILIEKDITGNYPETPREVLRLYGRITRCMYNETLTDKEFEQLSDQLRLLFDDELLANNPRDKFLVELKADIGSYKEESKIISDYQVQRGSATDYGTIDDKEYATLKMSMFLQTTGTDKSYSRVYEEFLLRQDEKECWKILHWQLTDNADMD